YFDINFVYSNKTKTHNYPDLLNYKTFIYSSIGHPTTFIKKDLFKKVGLYDENLKIVSDWKFFIDAVVKHNCSSRKINSILTVFYLDGISSNNKELVAEERQDVLKNYYSDYIRLNELEIMLKNIKRSKTIKMLQKLGLLRYIEKKI